MRHEPGPTPAPRPAKSTPARVAPAWRLLLVVVGATALVGLGWASSASAAAATVDAATSSNFGTVLTDAQGFALYTLPTDHGGMSTCTGACISVWPALTVPAGTTPTEGAGVSGTVAAVLQSNGTYQVTYNGSPLYTFVGDTTPGQVSGNNIGGFTVVMVAASTTPSTSTPPPVTTASTTPTSTVPAPSGPTGTASTTPSSASPSTGSAPQPATAAASAPSGPAAASSSPGAPTAPGSLAVTGPGSSLMWMVIVGAGLLAVSGSMLLALRHNGRRARRAQR